MPYQPQSSHVFPWCTFSFLLLDSTHTFFCRFSTVRLILSVLKTIVLSFLLCGWSADGLKIIFFNISKMINEREGMKGLMQELSGVWPFCCPFMLGFHFIQRVTHLLSTKQLLFFFLVNGCLYISLKYYETGKNCYCQKSCGGSLS